MTAPEVLAQVRAAGGEVIVDTDGPRLRVPKALRPLVEAHREEIRRYLAEQSGAAPVTPAMPSLTRDALAVFAQEGDSVGFRVPWCPKILWWAPTADEAAKLIAWGVAERGQVWTATELDALIGLAGPDATAVVLAKLVADGEVIETRRRPAA